MKKVIAILTNDEKFNITDLLIKETDNSVFLGSWSKFSNNETECVNAVATAVNIGNIHKRLDALAAEISRFEPGLDLIALVNAIKQKIIECDFNILYSNNI